MAVLPTQASLEAFVAEDDGGPVVMLNLVRYADGDRALYDEYSQKVLPFLVEYGGEVVYAGACSTKVIADESYPGEWDAMLLVRYPSRKAFGEMIADPEYLEVAALRERGLEDSVLHATSEWYPQPAG
ncbi:MAG TPA: DUF1330 domain-containing protein [Solirubrobacterales bacterium]|nr:DUF1330 domain-containing protein [Solirubrobacterales bacterium]